MLYQALDYKAVTRKLFRRWGAFSLPFLLPFFLSPVYTPPRSGPSNPT